MTQAVIVNSSGFYIPGSDIPDYDGSQPNLPDGQRLVTGIVPGGFYKPKYDGINWGEGATPDEIKAIQSAPAIRSFEQGK